MQVNMSIMRMIVVDTWLAYSLCTNVQDGKQKEFYTLLAEELINNSYEEVRRCQNGAGVVNCPQQMGSRTLCLGST